jgi:hypothetical protein
MMTKIMVTVCCLGLLICSCGPSPESMAKKNCELYKKYREAEKSKDSTSMAKYEKEMKDMDTGLKEKHKNNPEWLSTYSLERDACIIENMKKE